MTRSLADVVHVLTRPHATRNGDRVAYVEPLFDTLQSLVHPSSGARENEGGGGGGGSRPPVNLDAVSLWQEISRRIDREWPYAGHPSAVKVPYGKKLQAWFNTAVEPQQQARVYDYCTNWESRIRELQTRTKKMPIKGACPNCDKTHVETIDEEGSARYNPALMAYPGSTPIYAECLVCGERWEGSAIHDLSALMV